MDAKKMISTVDFCSRHNIKHSFIEILTEHGLIEIVNQQKETYILEEHLHRLEQIVVFNKELEINLEGVEVIMRLLERVHAMQEEMNRLKNRLGFYEAF